MRRLVLVLTLISSLTLGASVSEAAKTSAKEGRKFSRAYVKDAVRDGRLPKHGGWNQRDCWRIGRQGAGPYKIFPRGVVCVFSTNKRVRGTCGVYGVAVKDGRKRLKAANVSSVQIYRGDPADCNPKAFMDYPTTLKGGVVGGPL
jgi:hypothetical protein